MRSPPDTTWTSTSGFNELPVVAACGRGEYRRRLLSARLVAYFVLGLLNLNS